MRIERLAAGLLLQGFGCKRIHIHFHYGIRHQKAILIMVLVDLVPLYIITK